MLDMMHWQNEAVSSLYGKLSRKDRRRSAKRRRDTGLPLLRVLLIIQIFRSRKRGVECECIIFLRSFITVKVFKSKNMKKYNRISRDLSECSNQSTGGSPKARVAPTRASMDALGFSKGGTRSSLLPLSSPRVGGPYKHGLQPTS